MLRKYTELEYGAADQVAALLSEEELIAAVQENPNSSSSLGWRAGGFGQATGETRAS
ncbi:MAG: hypothetical protein WKH64_12540 [Chloroflexia bacterium]